MGAEDEFRKVAEDVRQLARALRQEIRSAQRDARGAARDARDEWRRGIHQYRGSSGWQPPRRPGYYSGWTPPSSSGRGGSAAPPAPPVYRPPAPPRPPRPPKVRPSRPPYRHKHDGSTLLSLLLLVVGLAWLVSQTHLFNVSAETVLALALALLGAGMVVTARTDWSLSRRHWPWWVGAALLAILIANSSNVGDGLTSLNFGPASFQPTSWTAAKGQVDNFAGPIRVDLTQMSGSLTGDETLSIRDTFGPVDVVIPNNPAYHVHITAKTVFGPAVVPDQTASGHHSERTADLGPSGGPTLTIDARTVAGPVTVTTGSRPTVTA